MTIYQAIQAASIGASTTSLPVVPKELQVVNNLAHDDIYDFANYNYIVDVDKTEELNEKLDLFYFSALICVVLALMLL